MILFASNIPGESQTNKCRECGNEISYVDEDRPVCFTCVRKQNE